MRRNTVLVFIVLVFGMVFTTAGGEPGGTFTTADVASDNWVWD